MLPRLWERDQWVPTSSKMSTLLVLCFFAAALHAGQAQFFSQQTLPQTNQPTSNTPQPQQVLPQAPQQVQPFSLPQNDVLYRCRQTTLATDADILTIQQSQSVPFTSTGRCLLACSAQQLGLMTAGQPFETQAAGVLAQTLFPARGTDYLFQNELMNAVNACPPSNAATQLAGLQLAQTGLQALSTLARQGRRR